MPEALTASFQIKISGSPLAEKFYNALERAVVDTSLHMPDMATLEFRLPTLADLDGELASVGQEVEILARGNPAVDRPADPKPLFKGKITAIEAQFEEGDAPKLLVRAYHSSFNLHLGTKYRSFVQVTDSDIASKIMGEVGLSAVVDSTSIVHKHVFQANLTDWDFLQQRAKLNGYVLVGRGSKLQFVKPSTLEGVVSKIDYKGSLIELSATLTAAGQVGEAQATAWDELNKQPLIGTSTADTWSTTSVSIPNGSKLSSGLGRSGAKLGIPIAAASVSEAQGAAKASYDVAGSQRMHAHGRCVGDPQMLAGGRVNISGIGSRFSGEYTITRARHMIDMKNRYETEFWIGGMDPGTLASALQTAGTAMQREASTGLVPAIVTNVNDEQSLGRVKVKYPWLGDTEESHWARLIAPGAGQDRGLIMVPEVNDEVIVGFLHGDINHPYVLGGVWNNEDTPPEGATPTGDSVDVRELRTRIGHKLTFYDKSGSEKIELIDKSGNFLLIDTSGKTITIETEGDFIVKAQGAIKMEGKSIDMQAKSGDLKMKGINVNAEGVAKIGLKAPMIDAAGSGPVTIKGNPVMLN